MNSKIYWKVQFTKGFKKSYLNLSEKDKWIVKHFLNDIRYLKDPRKHYLYSVCDDCPPSYCLFGVSDDGLGNKGLDVLIIIAKNDTLLGLVCKKRK
jgi:hypothetical protein